MRFLPDTATLARPLTALGCAAQQCLIHSPSGLCRRRADMCFLLLVIPVENNTRTAGALDTHLKTYSEIIFLAYASWLT